MGALLSHIMLSEVAIFASSCVCVCVRACVRARAVCVSDIKKRLLVNERLHLDLYKTGRWFRVDFGVGSGSSFKSYNAFRRDNTRIVLR